MKKTMKTLVIIGVVFLISLAFYIFMTRRTGRRFRLRGRWTGTK